ncbi:ferritin-like domain-containing protein [Chitinophaga nivalis]|uniref:PA2169 family four-helix-bundle protein n=1 Tax=Chitinophaga nivalis TaxID=2991709 RepID=A0ABT3IUW3_9BACT|nr:PA2169 family four-helix-bundle protein [Chitinophaga nivalis]MCW3462527.1 PA2169 family four-helix-bundle protein [Chitinophaga nivalis]MCW3487782.1 PA2169 family four-helix-bundle protein [Chitinophaga nivalis]
MLQQEQLSSLLRDLVKLNYDRVEGYKKAIAATDDTDLSVLFKQLIADSESNAAQLNAQLSAEGAETATTDTIAGKLYRTWMDVKGLFTGNDRESVLSSCEYGEDVIQRAYVDALKSEVSMPFAIRELISKQKDVLKNAHDTIKSYRDIAKVNHS